MLMRSIGRRFMTVAAPPKREQAPELEMNAEPVDEAREYAIATLKRKRKFAQNAVAYVAVNVLLWLIWLFTDPSANGSIPWPAWVSLIWGFFLALDGWRAYGRWPAGIRRLPRPRSSASSSGSESAEREDRRAEGHQHTWPPVLPAKSACGRSASSRWRRSGWCRTLASAARKCELPRCAKRPCRRRCGCVVSEAASGPPVVSRAPRVPAPPVRRAALLLQHAAGAVRSRRCRARSSARRERRP